MCIAAVIDVRELEQSQVCEETVQRWCVEEHAMDMDIAVLQQVEELECRVTSASLQVKVSLSTVSTITSNKHLVAWVHFPICSVDQGWVPPEPQSEREDLFYYEHKAVGKNESTDIVRRANNPLDIAVARLFELERNIERRYLKSPLSTTIQITLDNRGNVSIPAPATTASAECDG